MAAVPDFRLPAYSLWAATPLYRLGDGTICPGLLVPPLYPHASDRMYEVSDLNAGRLDLIAADLLGDPRLYWVLAALNGIVDPFNEPRAGARLYVPTLSRLRAAGVLGP